jgi:hypothetical protein
MNVSPDSIIVMRMLTVATPMVASAAIVKNHTLGMARSVKV